MDNSADTSSARDIYHRADPEFAHKLRDLYSGDTLKFCYQCGTCTANCPLSQLIGLYRPNKILELSKLGVRNMPQYNALLLCSACKQCTKNCPQGVKVHEIMRASKELAVNDQGARDFLKGGLKDALAALAEEIPFPVSYCWISLSPPDEGICNGGGDGGRESVGDGGGDGVGNGGRESGGDGGDDGGGDGGPADAFFELARSVLLESLTISKREPPPLMEDAAKVAVVGSGPAGLTAAMELRNAGLAVTVFEPLPKAGGMLAAGIPSYRLPKEIVSAEVENIRASGVDIHTNTPVDKALFREILGGGEYKAVFIATGAPMARGLHIDGEELEGVVSALDYLRGFNLDGSAKTGKNVVVIGGGNVGIDAARTALRCGAGAVRLFCLESRAEMPSHEWEIQEAAAEGIVIEPSFGPKSILGEDGKVTGVEFIRCKSVFDDHGRFSPVFDEKTSVTADADMVITAIGQSPDLNFLQSMADVDKGAIAVDPLTMETSLPGVFAGGDSVSGTASLIEAVIAGRTAAGSIIRYLR